MDECRATLMRRNARGKYAPASKPISFMAVRTSVCHAMAAFNRSVHGIG